MASLKDTAYPYLSEEPTERELALHFSPDRDDHRFVASLEIKRPIARIASILFLKAFKRLGRPVQFEDIPEPYRKYVMERTGILARPTLSELKAFERSGPYRPMRSAAFDHLNIKRFDSEKTFLIELVAAETADVRHYVSDIINVMLEELIHMRTELPAYSTLVRIAQHAQLECDTRNFSSITDGLSAGAKKKIDEMLKRAPDASDSTWSVLKREPKKPTNKEVRSYLQHVKFLQGLAEELPKPDIAPAKLRQYRNLARATDASEMAELKPLKRYALAVILVHTMHAQALDDAAELLIRLMQNLENSARAKLLEFQQDKSLKIDELVEQLRDILDAYQIPGSKGQRFDAISSTLRSEPERIIEDCEELLAYSGRNSVPFMVAPYKAVRAQLLNCIEITAPRTSTDDDVMERMMKALRQLRTERAPVVSLATLGLRYDVDFGWLASGWRKWVFAKTVNSKSFDAVNRNFFELAVLQQIKEEFKTGDLYIKFGDRYDDYREQLASKELFEAELPKFGEVRGIDVDPSAFVVKLKEEMLATARKVDQAFPKNSHALIEDGRLVMRKPTRQEESDAVMELEKEVTARMEPTSIVDVLTDVTRWLTLQKHFGHIGGSDGRLEDRPMRLVASLFCYGCNLGPTQTARSIKGLSRKQLAWLNLKYATEGTLESAITTVINAYNKLELPGYWGTGQHASADGTKWNLYEQNLISEYHLRYGSYGGIGYYHTSDKYIALFSHFMACGRYEGTYILDGLMGNESDIRPDTVHGDTQAQNYSVFALSHLLGIKLMPRIRGIRDLSFYRPDGRVSFDHIDELFDDPINWKLIEQHLPSMFRIAVSIKLGLISPSSILRRLGAQNRKNKMYFAFRELGKVVRTMYLLEYIHDVELRQMVHTQTNKSEQFNGFAKWSFFGGDGVIAENLRHEQSKIIKYNHLVANMVIFHNAVGMSRVLRKMVEEGVPITAEMLGGLAPLRPGHINRFGDYTLDFRKKLEPLRFDAPILPKQDDSG